MDVIKPMHQFIISTYLFNFVPASVEWVFYNKTIYHLKLTTGKLVELALINP